jgi:uncharacterized membrane protein YhaH (DUF805 family)
MLFFLLDDLLFFNVDELKIMSWTAKKTFPEWILVFAKLYFLPVGRIGRIDFLISFTTAFFILLLGIIFPLSEIEFKILGTKFIDYSVPPGKEYISQIINISAIICIWILLANTIKRLRDLGTKLWYTILVLVPALNLLVLLGLMLSEGSPGMNQYGPPKKPLSL